MTLQISVVRGRNCLRVVTHAGLSRAADDCGVRCKCPYSVSAVAPFAEQHCDVDTPVLIARGEVQVVGTVKQIGIE